MKVTLITGGAPHYEAGLVTGLVQSRVALEVIGNVELGAMPEMSHPLVQFRAYHCTSAPGSSRLAKGLGVARAYLRLLLHPLASQSRLFHIQWPYKLVFFDRTLLNVWYKALGKKLIFTAHNIDQAARDGKQSWRNRLSLRFHYWIVDHIIVHTELMREELVRDFGLKAEKISVIPHGVMSCVAESTLTRAEARHRLGLKEAEKTLLIFGLISPYKGVEQAVEALHLLRNQSFKCRLLIVGKVKKCQAYWDAVQELIKRYSLQESITTELRHIPDSEIEVYFKAADVLVMPYRSIFQSGVLFLGYRFGLPVIASDVGSLREDIVEGKTGYLSRANDPPDLARAITQYFSSDLFRELESRRDGIRSAALDKYSWTKIGAVTRILYSRVLGLTNARDPLTAPPDAGRSAP